MKKNRSEKKQPTAEELIRKEDLKFKRLATKLATEWAEKDADVGRQMVAKVFGFETLCIIQLIIYTGNDMGQSTRGFDTRLAWHATSKNI